MTPLISIAKVIIDLEFCDRKLLQYDCENWIIRRGTVEETVEKRSANLIGIENSYETGDEKACTLIDENE